MRLAAAPLLLALAGPGFAQDAPLMTCQMVDAQRNLVTFDVTSTGGLSLVLKFLESGQVFTAMVETGHAEMPGAVAIISNPSPTGEVLIGQLRLDGALGMIYANPTDANRTRYLGNCDGYQAAFALWNETLGEE
ncbi:MAG: hypothetical protein GKR99_12355 [Rhodobacteraceae bacterium]|nr:hypothetical protein [Paracoccaceae bacterium]